MQSWGFDRNHLILRVCLNGCGGHAKQFPETRGGSSRMAGVMCSCGGNGVMSVMSPDVYGMSGLYWQVSDSGSADGRNICDSSRFWSASGLSRFGTCADERYGVRHASREGRYEKSDNMIEED